MFQEFGTPVGPGAKLSRSEYRRLWLEAEYPSAWKARSPRSCASDELNSLQLGCDVCLQQVGRLPTAPIECPEVVDGLTGRRLAFQEELILSFGADARQVEHARKLPPSTPRFAEPLYCF